MLQVLCALQAVGLCFLMRREAAASAFSFHQNDSEHHQHDKGDRSKAHPNLGSGSDMPSCLCTCSGNRNNILLGTISKIGLIEGKIGLFVIGDEVPQRRDQLKVDF